MVRIALCFALFRLFTTAVTVWIRSNKRCIRVEPRHLRFPLQGPNHILYRYTTSCRSWFGRDNSILFVAPFLCLLIVLHTSSGCWCRIAVYVGWIMLHIYQHILLFFEAIWLVLSRVFVESYRRNQSSVVKICLVVITPNIRWAQKRLSNIRRVPRELSHACFLVCGWSSSWDHLGLNVHPPLFATPLTF